MSSSVHARTYGMRVLDDVRREAQARQCSSKPAAKSCLAGPSFGLEALWSGTSKSRLSKMCLFKPSR